MISGTKEIITDEIALSERAEEIDTLHEGQLVQEIVKLLKRTLRKNDNLFALSAPAIGFNKRIFCMKFEKDQIRSKRNHFEIYKIKRGRTSRIFLEDELIFEVKVNKKWFKIEYEVNVKEDFSDNVLFILFFYFLTKEVNGIGGNYD